MAIQMVSANLPSGVDLDDGGMDGGCAADVDAADRGGGFGEDGWDGPTEEDAE